MLRYLPPFLALVRPLCFFALHITIVDSHAIETSNELSAGGYASRKVLREAAPLSSLLPPSSLLLLPSSLLFLNVLCGQLLPCE